MPVFLNWPTHRHQASISGHESRDLYINYFWNGNTVLKTRHIMKCYLSIQSKTNELKCRNKMTDVGEKDPPCGSFWPGH